jgi:hypothetical protein
MATRGLLNAVLVCALCPLPLTTLTLPGAPATFVNEKAAAVPTPVAVAVTLYPPVTAFAVNAGEVAWPSAPVITVVAPPNVALAPVAGAANVTLTPATGLPPESFTTATSGLLKAVLTFALCPLPLTTLMVAAEPAVLVNANEAGVAMFVAVAVTE